MKLLTLLSLIALQTPAFADQVIAPTVEKCADDFNYLQMISAPASQSVTTVADDINVFALIHSHGDPAVWSMLHKIAITFPVTNTDGMTNIACYTIDQAAILDIKKVKSVAYDAKIGRLLEIPVTVATHNDDVTAFGSKEMKLKVRVNKATKTVTLE